MISVKVSGKTFYACLDPNATAVPTEEGWPEPTWQKRGKGWTLTYELTVEQATEMWDHLDTMAYCMGVDVEDKSESRAIAKDRDKLKMQLDGCRITS